VGEDVLEQKIEKIASQVKDMKKAVFNLVDPRSLLTQILHILVNNAGVIFVGTVLSTPEEAWDRVMGVNVKGVYLCSRYAIPVMSRQGGGSIINIDSVLGLVGSINDAAYVASKGAVVQ
jgi:NAD(P)-dependent dehydrogenase (short-subunit alcohol dehydrogenase family)